MINLIRKVKTPENNAHWTEAQFKRLMFWESVRDSIKYAIPFWIRDGYDNLCYWLNPRQKWLTKEIPNHWSDKTYLIPKILTTCLIHFVEEEKCFTRTDYSIYDKDGKDTGKLEPFAEELQTYYLIAKTTLPELRAQIDLEWNKVIDKLPGAKTLDELYKLDEDYDELESVVLVWVVKNRNSLWT